MMTEKQTANGNTVPIHTTVYEDHIPQDARASNPGAHWVVHEGCVNSQGMWFPRREFEELMLRIRGQGSARSEGRRWLRSHPRRDEMFDSHESATVANIDELNAMLKQGNLPLSFDIDTSGVEPCARQFALENEIPFERLDLSVFEALTRIRTIKDVACSQILFPTAKTAIQKCFRKAFDTNQIRSLSTQGLAVPLVLPTPAELQDPTARINIQDCPDASGWKTMSDLPFFSTCVSHKFLVLAVAPGGDVALLPDMHSELEVQTAMNRLKPVLSKAQETREDTIRTRLQRKLEKKGGMRRQAPNPTWLV